jgi:hypothetical protein
MYGGDSEHAKAKAVLALCAQELKFCAGVLLAFGYASKSKEHRDAYFSEAKRCIELAQSAGMVAGVPAARGSGEVAITSDEIAAVAEAQT